MEIYSADTEKDTIIGGIKKRKDDHVLHIENINLHASEGDFRCAIS